jgi:hypothetical protein
MKKYVRKKLAEDGAPANSAGGGGVASIGINPPDKPSNFGEPGVLPKQQGKNQKKNAEAANQRSAVLGLWRRQTPIAESSGCQKGSFAGEETFIVPADVFFGAREARKKGKHWSKYIGDTGVGPEIREYYHKHKGKKPIILQDERTGAMHYAHYGRKRK